MHTPWYYLARAVPVRAIDGDTIEVVVDLSRKIYHRENLRINDLWCSEINTEEGRNASSFTEQWLAAACGSWQLQPNGDDWPLVIRTFPAGERKYEKQSFTRYVADVLDWELNSLAEAVIAAGLGTKERSS